jgi:hypothetical protein
METIMLVFLFSCITISNIEQQAFAGTSCTVGNKTKYTFLVDTYNGSNRTGGNRVLSSNSSPSMSFNKGQKIVGRPSGDHGKTFSGICSEDKMYVIDENGAVFLQ